MTGIDGGTLREWRRSRGWDVPETARQLRRAAKGGAMPAHDALVRMVYRWERQGLRTERYELLYARTLAITSERLASGPGAAPGRSEARGEPWPPHDTDLTAAGDRVAAGAPRADEATDELCAMLTDYGAALGRFASAGTDEIVPPADLERDLRTVFTAYQQSRFAAATSRATMLLADAQLAAQGCAEAERPRVTRVLALAYQAAATVLVKAGEPALAWIAAERGLNAADAAGSKLIRGSLLRSVAFALLSMGRLEPAMALAESAADHLRGDVPGDEAATSAYGTLLLVGALAAARFGDASKTDGYLREAGAAAQRLGRDGNYLWTAFGPTNVAIHRVNAAAELVSAAAELGDFQEVLDGGLSLDTHAVPAERRARYLLDVARVHAIAGDRDDALRALLDAEAIAPEQVRRHYLGRKVVAGMLRDTIGKPSVALDRLAGRMKIRETA